jgi:hypothetical protein
MNNEQIYYNSLLLYNNYPTLLYEKILNKKINIYKDYIKYLENKKKDITLYIKILKNLINKHEKILEFNNKIINYNNLLYQNIEIKDLEKSVNKQTKNYLKYISLIINKIEKLNYE